MAKKINEEKGGKEAKTEKKDQVVASNDAVSEFEEHTVVVNRSTKVVKGGKNFSFSALIVVGNRNGKVGMGFGKANELSDAMRKGAEQARRHVIDVPMNGDTITHRVESAFCGAKIMIRPASAGTGLIAGGGMRYVLELAGVKDVLAKSMGSNNGANVVKATFDALRKLRTKSEVLAKRDLTALN